MNRFRWRSRPDVDAPDPVLEAWFALHARLPGGDDAAIERGRRLVATKLAAPEPANGGSSLMRRLTWAGLGGGGLWASVAGVAAAHPLVGAATALALVAGGATAVEVSGVGPAVRETVGIHARGVEDATPTSTAMVAIATSTADAGLEREPTESDGSAAIEPAPAGEPGNLVTQMHDGRFSLRAQVDAADGEAITLLTVEGVVTLPLAGDADVHIPGEPREAGDLASMAGRLAIVTGSCEPGIEVLGAGCTVERVQVLGSMPAETSTAAADLGTPGAPDDADAPGPGRGEDARSKDGYSDGALSDNADGEHPRGGPKTDKHSDED